MQPTSFVYWEESPLSPALDAIWTVEVPNGYLEPLPYRTLPDGCVDLIYRQKRDAAGNVDRAQLLVAGPSRGSSMYYPESGEEFVGIRFAPGWGGAALCLPASEMADCLAGAVSLTPALADLEKQLFACTTCTQIVTKLRASAEEWARHAGRHRRTLEVISA